MNFKFLKAIFSLFFIQTILQASEAQPISSTIQSSQKIYTNPSDSCCPSCSNPYQHLNIVVTAMLNNDLDLALNLMPALPTCILSGTRAYHFSETFNSALLGAAYKNQNNPKNLFKAYQLSLMQQQKKADAQCCSETMLGWCCYRPDEANSFVNHILNNYYKSPNQDNPNSLTQDNSLIKEMK